MFRTDEKIYHCLVKGGEDLRLDLRIERLFCIMNEMFASDVECSKREFKIGTFNIIPVKKNLGIMEWVKNTMPMTAVIEKETPKEENLLKNNAKKEEKVWSESLAKV